MSKIAAYEVTDKHNPFYFNEDMIRRRRLPADVAALVHDLCYHHDGRNVWTYVRRAQEILKRKRSPFVKGYSR